MFHPAERRQANLRLALCGPAGAGKTYSALLIARGLAPEGRLALIDSERGSGQLYADLTPYDVTTLDPPFTPARYIERIHQAAQAGYDVLIVDSLSHAWNGEGGILDLHDQVAAQGKSNAFMAWRTVTPQHHALVDALLGAPLHVIVTLRTKTAYEVVENAKGKKEPIKIGLAPVQREGLEYEFTTVLDLAVARHVASATKDRTGLFDGQPFVPTLATGQALRAWLDRGLDRGTTPDADPLEGLQRLKTAVSTLPSVAELNQWWRQQQSQIARLTPVEREALMGHCSDHKLALLEAAAATQPVNPAAERREHALN